MKQVIHLLSYVLLAGLSLGLSCTEQANSAEQAFESELLKDYLADKPQSLSKLRPHFLAEFGRHAHSLDALSLDAQKTSLQKISDLSQSLRQSDPTSNPIAQIYKEAELWFVDQKLEGQQFLLYQDPLSPLKGFHAHLMESLNLQLIQTKEDAEAYNARLKWIPKQIREVGSLIQARNQAGLATHPLLIKAAKAEIRKFLETPLDQNPIYRGFAIKLNGVNPTEMNLYEASDYLEVTNKNLKEIVVPAYQKLLGLIEELENQGNTTENRAASYPAYYAWKLKSYNGKEIDPELYFEKGLKELDSLRLIIEELAQMQAQSDKSKASPNSRKKSRLEQVQLFAAHMRKAREQMVTLFDSLPQKSPEIMPLPKHLQQEEVLSYEQASWDNERKPRIIVNFELWEEKDDYSQNSLLYKTLYPGLHSLSALQKKRASLLVAEPYPAWNLGWQDYALSLADIPLYLFSEKMSWQKAYQSDRFHKLLFLLTDLGIHHKKWSEKEAREFLDKNGNLSAQEVEKILLKAYADPGLLTTSWIGAREFQRLYEQAIRQQAGKFNYKTFHQTCFNHGPLPWFLLQRLIDA